MRIKKFDQDFTGNQPFAITLKDYDGETAPTVKMDLPRYCIRYLSELDMGTPEQKAYFAKHHSRILSGDDPDWVLAAVEVLADSSVALRFFSRSTRKKCAVLLNNRRSFHFELKVTPKGGSAVTETYSFALDGRKDMPRPYLMILYGYRCKVECAEVKENRSRLVSTRIDCLT